MNPQPASSLRILIVDDEVLTLRALQRMLKAHDVTAVSTAVAALATITGPDAFDVVLCDVMMPDVTGPELYARVRALHPGLERRFVFISGGAFGEQVLEFLDQVPNDIVPKPFERDMLLKAVQAVAGLAKSQSGPARRLPGPDPAPKPAP